MAGFNEYANMQKLQEQLESLNNRQQFGNNIGRSGVLISIEKTISNLSDDKKAKVLNLENVISAKNNYTQGLLDYMMSYYQDTYANTIGKPFAENLLEELNKGIKLIESEEEDDKKKIKAILALAESDPDIKSKINKIIK